MKIRYRWITPVVGCVVGVDMVPELVIGVTVDAHQIPSSS